MPVSDPNVIDGMGVDPSNGKLLMHMWEERGWENPMRLLEDLERKVGSYLAFLTSGQLEDFSELKDRQIDVQIFFQFLPPDRCPNEIPTSIGWQSINLTDFR